MFTFVLQISTLHALGLPSPRLWLTLAKYNKCKHSRTIKHKIQITQTHIRNTVFPQDMLRSADPALAGYRRVRYCLPSMSSLHVFLPLPLLCCLPSISSLHVFLPLSLLSSGDLGRVREGGWAAEKRLRGGEGPPPPTPQPSLCQSFPRSCGLWWSAWIPKKSIVEISGSNLMPK